MSVDFQVNVNVQPHGKEKIDELERQIERLKSETVRINFETEGTSEIEKAFKSMESQMQHQAVSAGKSFQKSFNKGMKSVGMDPVDYAKKQAKEQKEVEKIAKKMQDSVPEINYDFDEDVGKNAVKSAKKYLKEKEKAVEQSAKEQQKIAEQQAKAQQKAQEQNLKQTLKNQAAIDKIESRQSFAQYKQRAVDKNAHNNSLVNNAKQFYENKKAEIAEQQKIAEQQAKAQQKAQDKFNYNFDTGKYKADQSRMKSQLQSYSGQENEANIQKATGALKDYNDALNKLEQHRNGKNLSDSDYLKEMENLDKAASKFKNSMSEVRDTMSKTLAPGIAERGANKVAAYYEENSKAVKKYGESLKLLESQYRNAVTVEDKANAESSFNSLKSRIKAEGLEGKTATEEMKRAFSQIGEFTGMYGAIQMAFQDLPMQLIQSVKDFDDTMTSLQMSTGVSTDKAKELMSTYSEMGKSLKATGTDVAASSLEWLKQGKSIEEANALAQDSIVLSKIGDLSSTDATKTITAAMKSYQMSESQVMSFVDSISAIDMASATDVGGLANAFNEVAANAKQGGVESEKLLAYAAAIGETTQEGMASVGTSLNAIFSRMGNIKLSRLKDFETGEDLSNVETVLKGVEISLRDSSDEFREFDDVLDDTAERWDSFSVVQQRAVAQAFAGTNHMNDFMVLMQQWDNVEKYIGVANNASGESIEKYNAYTESLQGKLEGLKNSFQDFSNTAVGSDMFKGAIEGATGFVNAITGIVDHIGLLNTAMIGLGIFQGKTGSGKRSWKSPCIFFKMTYAA